MPEEQPVEASRAEESRSAPEGRAAQAPSAQPSRGPSTPAQIKAAHVAGAPRLNGRVELAEPDPTWPESYAREAQRIGRALGPEPFGIEHVGSTSVPGLPAKPILDILLTVPDPAEEPRYVPALGNAGYALVIREPHWYEHRMLRRPGAAPAVNLHVLPAGSAEVARMRAFRDRLRSDPADRDQYARTKRVLARRRWAYLQNYADAKTEVVEEILARAGSPRPEAGSE